MEGNNGELTQIKTHPYDRELARIKNFLKGSSKGYTVTEISHAIDINRNSVAKYLDVLCISGAVETQGHWIGKNIHPDKEDPDILDPFPLFGLSFCA